MLCARWQRHIPLSGLSFGKPLFRSCSVVPPSTLKEHEDHAPGRLVLEDGTEFAGFTFGKNTSLAGEVVFTTGNVGYPESMTDPSYRGQIVAFTQPLIGNYGVPSLARDQWGLPKFLEAEKIQTAGIIISDYSHVSSHWNKSKSLAEWMESENIPGLYGIDTRELTKILRVKGSMKGKIVVDSDAEPDFIDINQRNLVAEVSTKAVKHYNPDGKVKILAYDLGCKANIIRSLCERDAHVKLVPWDYDLTNEKFDGLFLSNGPGDPSMMGPTVEMVRKAMDMEKPIFGICLGHQIIGQAAGCSTYKLKFGNRGQNQPAINRFTDVCHITSQNHGYAVDAQALPRDWSVYFTNANDNSNEGIIHKHKPWFSVQFHPEARVGPYDTTFLFDKFLDKVQESKLRGRAHGFFTSDVLKDVRKVLVLGSGGLSIGQAGEFDYSGSQCIKALKEEGIETILINPNIATVMTEKGLADRVYFLPVTPDFVTEVMEREQPDGVVLSFGGQTALNCGVELKNDGVFEALGVKVLGTPVESIEATEDRDVFAGKLAEINQRAAPSRACNDVATAAQAAIKIGYPVMVRCAYSLGGLGSAIVHSSEELIRHCTEAFASVPQVLVEKDLTGWKEVEYEVVRDDHGNTITVCNMENFDPLGIHTGDSIVVAPSQTLSNEEYHKLRTAALDTINHLGIVGECNIQYALDPFSEEYCVIEVNARLSRSSALASKATGYPLAAVAAKLALGHRLPDLTNSVTKSTTACFEPSLDYTVVKMPRWDMDKFPLVDRSLGSAMKSVGEVMAVSRNFEESLQKALRMRDSSCRGFESMGFAGNKAAVEETLRNPTDLRIYALHAALSERMFTPQEVHDMTKIDHWFLGKLDKIIRIEDALKTSSVDTLSTPLLREAKRRGFSDKQIADFLKMEGGEMAARAMRLERGVTPFVKQIDTLSAEFPAQTNYLYMTYDASSHDVDFDGGGQMIVGSGVYRIGSSVEFDYCGVVATREMRKMGEKTIVVNYNPETVSTDYDESDRLYFEELSLERVMDIYDLEAAEGVLLSVGGQIPQNMSLPLHKLGYNVLGTHPEQVDGAEDRSKFSSMLDQLDIGQPEWSELSDLTQAQAFASRVGFPVLVRPSYVLSGAAMNIANTAEELNEYLGEATDVSPDHPVVISKFLTGFREIEFDGVAQNGEVVVHAIHEHVENGGVHSGDATLLLPPQTLSKRLIDTAYAQGAKIAKALEIHGPFNIQFLGRGGAHEEDPADCRVIECNLRASRSFPFCAKVTDTDFIAIATRVMLNQQVQKVEMPRFSHVGCKASQFSFQRLKGADPTLGVEMQSTGEVACFGENKYEAFLKALCATRNPLPVSKRIFFSVGDDPQFEDSARLLQKMGFTIFTDSNTAPMLQRAGVFATLTALPSEAEQDPGVRTSMDVLMTKNEVEWVIQIPQPGEKPLGDNYSVRRTAVDFNVPLLTDPNLAKLFVESVHMCGTSFVIKAHNHYTENIRR